MYWAYEHLLTSFLIDKNINLFLKDLRWRLIADPFSAKVTYIKQEQAQAWFEA